MSKSVSILGMGETLRDYLSDFEREYRRPTDKVWAINSVGAWFHDIDLIIAMDNFRRDQRIEDGKHRQYVENIVHRGKPILSDVTDPEWPQIEAYPLREVCKFIWPRARHFGDCRPMLMNTIDYAMAYAMYQGFEEIRLYGCDFRARDNAYLMAAVADEHQDKPYWWPYHMKRIVYGRRDLEPGEPTLCWLVGVARERGIKVLITGNSTLLDFDRAFYFYGYDEPPFLPDDLIDEL